MPRDYKIYLNDILESITKIEEYVKGIPLEELATDDMRKDAVIRNLTTIGEAAKNVPREVRSKTKEIEWGELSGLRDILIHQYFGTDLDTVWDVIKKELPKVKESIRAFIRKQ